MHRVRVLSRHISAIASSDPSAPALVHSLSQLPERGAGLQKPAESTSNVLYKLIGSLDGNSSLSAESLQAFNNILFLVNAAPSSANSASIFEVMLRSSSPKSDLLPFLSQVKIPRSALGGADYATFIATLVKVKPYLPAWYYACLVLGRAVGDLDRVLAFAAQRFTQDIKLQNEFAGALAYPALMIVLAVAAIAVLVTTILPRNIMQFEALNLAVPPFLTAVHTVVNRVDYFWAALVYLVPAAFSTRYLPFRTFLRLAYVKLHTPWSHLTFLRDKATVLYILSILDKEHVTSKLILASVNVTRNLVLQHMLESMAAKARAGSNPTDVLSYMLTQSHVFSPYEVAYMKACLVSGKHSVVQDGLRYLSSMSTRQYIASVRSLLGAIQPATTVLVGALVVFIAAVGIVPLIQLTSAISKQ